MNVLGRLLDALQGEKRGRPDLVHRFQGHRRVVLDFWNKKTNVVSITYNVTYNIYVVIVTYVLYSVGHWSPHFTAVYLHNRWTINYRYFNN